jgi:hypothetical protein
MAEPMSVPSLKTIFRFPFQGAGWEKRFLVGTLLTFVSFIIPIVPVIFVCGYLLEVIRRAVKGEEMVLPDWTDWGKLGLDGLKYFVVNLVFLLPGTLIYVVGFGFYFIATFSMSFGSAFTQNSPGVLPDAFVPVFMLALLVFFISMFLGPLLFILGAIPLPAAIANLAAEGHLAAGFRLRQWWPALWKNKLGYFITWTILFGLFFILYLVFFLVYITCILCWLIPFLLAPMGFYLGLVYAALFGLTFRESLEVQAVETPVAPPAGPTETVEHAESAEAARPDLPEAPADGAAGEVPQV